MQVLTGFEQLPSEHSEPQLIGSVMNTWKPSFLIAVHCAVVYLLPIPADTPASSKPLTAPVMVVMVGPPKRTALPSEAELSVISKALLLMVPFSASLLVAYGAACPACSE